MILCFPFVSSVKEANDACLWLKAAGFPQYVQMFEGESIKALATHFISAGVT